MTQFGPTSIYMFRPLQNGNEERTAPSTEPQRGFAGDVSAEPAPDLARAPSSFEGWNRFIPEGLPSDLHDELFGYFYRSVALAWPRCWLTKIASYINPFTQFTDQRRFLADMQRCVARSSTVQRTAFYSPLLHNVLLALGSKLSADPRIRSDNWRVDLANQPVQPVPVELRGLAFANRAQQILLEEMTRPMLSSVIGSMLLGTFHQMDARGSLGWIYEGIGTRLALTRRSSRYCVVGPS